MSRFCRFYTFAVFASWAALALWAACSMIRFKVLVLMVVLSLPFVALSRGRGLARGFLCGIKQHWKLSLFAVIAVGLVLRIWLFAQHSDTIGNVRTCMSDYVLLWDGARLIAKGAFPDSKSWMSILLYGAVRFCFGSFYPAAIVFSVLLQSLTCVFLFLIGRQIKGVVCGIVLAALFYWAHAVFVSGMSVATENAFAFFAAFFVLVLVRLLKCENRRRSYVLCFLCGVLAWFAIWSRGEGGVLLWGAFAVTLAMWFGFYRREFKWLARQALVFALVFAGGAGVAYGVHAVNGTPKTILCSTDNYWPRLFGANVKTGGRYCFEDKKLLFSRYKADHPDCDWPLDTRWGGGSLNDGRVFFNEVPACLLNQCPKEMIPYIQKEIATRWGALSLKEKVLFVIRKERVWSEDMGGLFGRNRFSAWFFYLLNRVTPVLFSFGTLLFIALLARRKIRLEFRDVLVLSIPFLLMAGMAAVFVFTEVSPRYTYVAYVFGSLPFAWFVGSLADRPRSDGA